jgi:hypothetical protein
VGHAALHPGMPVIGPGSPGKIASDALFDFPIIREEGYRSQLQLHL